MTATVDFLLNIIPSSVVDAFAKGDILQVLLFAVLFGFALHALGGRDTVVFKFIDQTSHMLFRIVGTSCGWRPSARSARWPSPSASTASARSRRWAADGHLYATCLIFVFLVLGTIAARGLSIWRFTKYIREELLIVLGTTSSERCCRA